ncbi:exonuclease SbcCD subunit D C-terminal domain-containing protein [Azospirillum doebereinerae]|uniref:exonuclease SbcCD subunit D C-terminal domain-containing protein n=2 Tax=Azospirillum doebereinerae TaxID=92933 RepID=UPI001EE54817|nr:exonuclease SbcCD subunit D C-terminal domain-containing protein [Azospirillum doebereinerae]MCG5244284.1 exonuclease SbcCD subunit D C-terminal domain-containing protein [Azospirillum doebereinerae]
MRSLRVLHTADWHLGQTLHGVARDPEHARFLDWLLDRIGEHGVDALVIAGDVFDGQNPPIPALALFYRFLARAKTRFPALDVVVLAGNHDSASRLEAPSPLMKEMGVQVVGALPCDGDGLFDPAAMVVPLHDRDGAVAARCVAMPYLRPSDLPTPEDEEGTDPLIEGVRRLYERAGAAGRAAIRPGEALILTGHCYMRGGSLSDLSERKILGGNLHALPVEIFPEDAAYVALGHLHRAQAVGGREEVRYSGSPLPLAIDEEPYPHQVVLAEFAGGRLVGRESLRVPRFVAIRRIPGNGRFATPDEALDALRRLDLDEALPRDSWPFLELSVALPEPRPALRDEVEAVLAGQPVRLLKLSIRLTGSGEALADSAPVIELADLAPEDVFRRIHRRSHEADPAPALMAAFHELLTAVQERE